MLNLVAVRNYNQKDMSSTKTLQKCRKIMSLFNQSHHFNKQNYICNSKPITKTHTRKNSINNRKSTNSIHIKVATNKQTRNSSKKKINYSPISPAVSITKNKRSVIKESFKNPYNKTTRFEETMKLNVKKPTYKRNKDKRNSYLESSMGSSLHQSLNSSISSFAGTPLKGPTKNKQTRYQKIMKLRVQKPQIQSTLKDYKPSKSTKKPIKPRSIDDNSVLLLKQCKQKLNQEKKQIQKQDRLWKVFERERDIRVKQQKKNKEKQYEREMSLEKRFDNFVKKQLKKIEEQKYKHSMGDSLLF